MIRFLLTALFSVLPVAAFAQQAAPQYYTFEPSATFSTLGISYTIAMMVAFLAVGWYAKSRVSTSDDYFAAGRSFGGISNGLAMSSNYMSLATFLGFTALLWRMLTRFLPLGRTRIEARLQREVQLLRRALQAEG